MGPDQRLAGLQVGEPQRIQPVASGVDELEAQVFRWQGGKQKPGVERLDSLLDGLPSTWINIDRSWSLWPELLDHLAEKGVEDRVLMKSPPKAEHLRALAEHPVPFLYFPIIRTHEEFEASRLSWADSLISEVA